ncbi:MAG: hypothetical protein IJX88_06080 [Clostridia bacterium]|nr:hypothetical protein [Clostridia bacterium]
MNAFFNCFRPVSHKRSCVKVFIALFICCLLSFFLSACKKETDYFSYVSELRSNLLLAENDGLALRIYAVKKENPYLADGIPRDSSPRVELYLSAPAGDKDCTVSFSVDKQTLGGDMSFDSVKAEYYYSCTADLSDAEELLCTVTYGENSYELTAKTVRNNDTLSPKEVLKKLLSAETQLFTDMTDKYGFTGEIYLRLLYEDAPYYYIGIIDRNGNTTAFLLSAKTGKVLAKRQT